MAESNPSNAQRNAASRRRRTIPAVLGFCAIMALVWLAARAFSYPGWFLGLLLTLALVNLLAWVLEPVAADHRLQCKGCGGRMRPVEPGKPCPDCGAQGFRVPWLNRAALALIVLLLAVYGSFILLGSAQEKKSGFRLDYALQGLSLLALTAVVVAHAFGHRISQRLPQWLQRNFIHHEVDEDVERLRWQPYMAMRMILFVSSLFVFLLAVMRLIYGI